MWFWTVLIFTGAEPTIVPVPDEATCARVEHHIVEVLGGNALCIRTDRPYDPNREYPQ